MPGRNSIRPAFVLSTSERRKTVADDKLSSNLMWGGRFAGGPAALMREINASIGFDKRLWREDIAASLAHVAMLETQGIVSEADASAIAEGLERIEDEYARLGVREDPALEDIHMHVEARLAELIGPAAGRLHTARSRNDQVATDFRLWVRNAVDETDSALAAFQRVLVARAEEHVETVLPGLTHLQTAQPVTLGHHFMAYYEMLARDRSRFADARERLNECPLGAAALAGTGFPIDRDATAAALGFDRPCANSLDAVSDRDFALDYLMAATQCALHLSRLAEELILWASQPFGFVRLPDSFSTGSSIMPQKRNPDAAELVRGHSGRIAGAMVALTMTMKSLPLAYSKDMQDDKPPVFEAHDLLLLSLQALAAMIEATSFDSARMRSAAEAASPPPPTSPTGWCARRGCRSARRTISSDGRCRRRRRGASGSPSWSWPNCRRSTRGSTRGSTPSSPSTLR